MQVLVLGSAGQLGRELGRWSWPREVALTLRSRAEVDITDPRAVEQAVGEADVVVNAAAYTAVDRAETEVERAFQVNRDASALLAQACARGGQALLQVSTDYVFDGSKAGAYVEDDPVAPLGVYGASKLAGEEAIRATWEQHWIVRTSWVMGAFGNNFAKTMLRLAREKDRLRVVADQHGRPTLARELASVIAQIVQRKLEGTPIAWGTYHFAAAGRASWCDVARHIVELQAAHTGRKPPVDAITTAEYPTPAKRPQNSELDTAKLERALGFRPAAWQDGMSELVNELLRAG
jgi:dTDP-4-dehydrorhamnose reductase